MSKDREEHRHAAPILMANTTSSITIHVGMAMCGIRNSDFTSIKALCFFTKEHLHFHIVVEEKFWKSMTYQVRCLYEPSCP